MILGKVQRIFCINSTREQSREKEKKYFFFNKIKSEINPTLIEPKSHILRNTVYSSKNYICLQYILFIKIISRIFKPFTKVDRVRLRRIYRGAVNLFLLIYPSCLAKDFVPEYQYLQYFKKRWSIDIPII